VTRVVRAAREGLLGAAAALAALAAIGAWPTWRWAGVEGLAALAAGCAIAALGAFVGAAPVLRSLAAAGGARPHVAAGWAMALRSATTLAAALVVALGSELPRRPLAIWVAVAYGALLVVETRWTLRWLRAGGAD
jgi:hypothetical protein